MKKETKVILFVVLLALAAFVMLRQSDRPLGIAPGGGYVLIASSTIRQQVGSSTPTTIFAVNTACSSRVISTVGRDITLTFSTSTDLASTNEPTATYGHVQLASTTVVYDAGVWGCGLVQAFGYEVSSSDATTTISTTEYEGFR